MPNKTDCSGQGSIPDCEDALFHVCVEGGGGAVGKEKPIRRSPGEGLNLAQPFLSPKIRFYSLGDRVSLALTHVAQFPKAAMPIILRPGRFSD